MFTETWLMRVDQRVGQIRVLKLFLSNILSNQMNLYPLRPFGCWRLLWDWSPQPCGKWCSSVMRCTTESWRSLWRLSRRLYPGCWVTDIRPNWPWAWGHGWVLRWASQSLIGLIVYISHFSVFLFDFRSCLVQLHNSEMVREWLSDERNYFVLWAFHNS